MLRWKRMDLVKTKNGEGHIEGYVLASFPDLEGKPMTVIQSVDKNIYMKHQDCFEGCVRIVDKYEERTELIETHSLDAGKGLIARTSFVPKKT